MLSVGREKMATFAKIMGEMTSPPESLAQIIFKNTDISLVQYTTNIAQTELLPEKKKLFKYIPYTTDSQICLYDAFLKIAQVVPLHLTKWSTGLNIEIKHDNSRTTSPN